MNHDDKFNLDCPDCGKDILASIENESCDCTDCQIHIMYELDGDDVIITETQEFH
ncbi:hypothetical protein WAF17_16685 [Bernardetia sp. ABR2-2B]|uniref:hypothetical protein n=1 Tax=Bernardetia sp. ABR2-2B TaxID=3127472 RepID=UPI0030CBE22C